MFANIIFLSCVKRLFFFPVYVDASPNCNDLAFQLGTNAAAATTRSWSIKVTQYSCDYPNLAPSGCDQVLLRNG